ncbi:hypothetical protein Ciccas_012895 [Cichlidogyrus casuarinus]|uniref:Uncharacterized protein n=1 Tax=Cichlidogyrus casuarinus TaxID=1844966 RepID=A0ABD2PNW3_9PLAT
MFPLCDSGFSDDEIDSYITFDKDTIDYDEIEQVLQKLGRIYENKDGSSTPYMMVTAYVTGMQLVLGILMSSQVKIGEGSEKACGESLVTDSQLDTLEKGHLPSLKQKFKGIFK